MRFFLLIYKQKRAIANARKKRPSIDTPIAIIVVCFPPPPDGGATSVLLFDGGGGKVLEGIVGVGSGVNAEGGGLEDGVPGEEIGDCEAFDGEGGIFELFGGGLGVCHGERGLLEVFGGELGICGGEIGLWEVFGGELGVCGGGRGPGGEDGGGGGCGWGRDRSRI
ncbi:hypothetical protein RND71_027874 [Anisodus tanguticus]|uniref:Uncharacterized protein n=1 Tax=Anisodus tanguticus TaxID=243964 RepID=A0AAE1RJT1_9SOLA|nr:hypothetical protein RND71_027874 [Anisodus tanguticus]